jgi:hypothetical protein
MSRRLSALALAAALMLSLTACTAPGADPATGSTPGAADQPGDAGQSTADACAIVQGSIDDATAAFSEASVDDPATVVEAMQAASAELETVSAQVTNDEVAALVPSLRALFDQAAEAMDALASGDVTRLGEINETAESFTETTARFQELCANG